ncbi:MAG: hypothetical protein ACRYFU_04565 [Janthinobacterium lividum]
MNEGSVTTSSEAFPRSWSATILQTPPLIAPARQFVYPQNVPGEEDALSRGALLLNVRPATGGTFLATCALGFRDPSLPSGVWACPAADDLLAIAGGYGYRLNTLDPSGCEFLALKPIASVLPAPAEKLLLLAGFHHVLALGEQGVLWQTARLSWEGVTLREVRNGKLHGDGWDMFTDREIPFSVDLRTGEHEGGGYRKP